MKKYFKIVLTWMLMLAVVLPSLQSIWIVAAETTDPIIETPPPIVVYINEGTVSSMSAEALKIALESLKAEIRAGLPDEYKNVEIIFTISDVQLDASNLEEWYIYDHTDTGYTASAKPVSTDKHIYSSHAQNVTGSNTTGTSNIKMEAMKVSEWVKNPPKYYNGGTANAVATLGVFDQHINVDVGNSTNIDFVGYYNSAYFDFMLYPCEVEGKKLVTFGIDSSAVNGHTLGSAGFLINSGIDSNGYLQGYYLCYHYNANNSGEKSTPSFVRLYKFNGNKTADQFHDYLQNNTSTATDYTTFFGSAIVEIPLTQNTNFWTQMNVTLEISPTSLIVSQKATGSPAAATKVIDIDSSKMADTGYNGFGPAVGYVTHSCARATLFTYSNIKMYTIHPDSLYDILEYGSYPEDASIYFVDLADNASTRTEYPTYEEAIEYIEDEGIYYLPNYTPPTGIKKGEELTKNNVDDLANEIARYIISTYQKPAQADDSDPIANLTLTNKEYESDNNNGGVYPVAVKYVRRDLIKENETVEIYGFDILSTPSDSQAISEYSYTITGPAGFTTIELTGEDSHTDANGLLLEVTNNAAAWPAGIYTVTLTVTDDSNPEKTSESVTKTFAILEDVTPPEIKVVTVDYDDWKLTFSASDLGKNDAGPDNGATTAYGLYNYEVVLTPNNIGDTFAGYTYDDETGTWIYADYVTPGQHADSLTKDITPTDIPLPKGEYTLVLRVYDEAGNFTEVNLPAIDFIKEELTGIGSGVADVDGIMVTNGSCGIDESWIGRSVDYTTSSNTDVTVILPGRPSAPTGVDSENTSDGGMKLTGVDMNMEYKGKNDAEYTDVTNVNEEDDSIIVPVDEYEVRYKAIVGESFASPDEIGIKITTYEVTVKENLDGNEWNDADAPTITLQYIIDNDTDGVVLTDLSQIPTGKYKILANGKDTGETVTVIDSNPSEITLNYYTLTLSGDSGVDEVRAGGDNVITLGDDSWAVLSGSSVTFSAKLKGGYSWMNWTPDSGTYDTRSKTITMTGPLSLTANSAYTAVAVTVNRDDEEAGGSTDWGNWTTGSAPVITYARVDNDESNPDYKDENYKDDEMTGAKLTNLENRTGTFRIYVDGNLIDKYVEMTDGVPSNPVALNFYTLTLKAGTGINFVDNDGNSGATVSKIYLEGTQVNISANVDSGYYWSKWTGDDGGANANQNDTITITKDLTLTATAAKNTVAININRDGSPWSRTVTLKPSGGGTDITFASNSPVSNVPDGTYEIYVNGADTSKTIIVSGGSVTETLDYYTVTLISGNGIGGTSGGGVYLAGSTVNISASLGDGYAWNGWTGSFTAGKRNSAITINGTVTLTANASYIPPTYEPAPPPGTETVVTEEQEQPGNQTSIQSPNRPSGQKPNGNNTAITQYPAGGESESDAGDNDSNQTDYEQANEQNSQENSSDGETSGENIFPSEHQTDQPRDTGSNPGNADNAYDSDDTNSSGDKVITASEERGKLIAAGAVTLPDGRLAKDLGNDLYEIFDENGMPLGYIQLKPGEEIEKVDINERIFTTITVNSAPALELETMKDEKTETSDLPVTGGVNGILALLLGIIMTVVGIGFQNKKSLFSLFFHNCL